MTRFLCIGDLHGHLPSVPDDLDFDAVIATGDVCDHELRTEKFAALTHRLETGEDVAWYDRIGRDEAKRRIDASIGSGNEVIERLASFDVPVFIIPGNWDWTASGDSDWDERLRDRFSEMIEPYENVFDIDAAAVGFDDVTLIGYGDLSGTELPFFERDSFDDDEWAALEEGLNELRELYEDLYASAEGEVILVSHVPPYETALDTIDRPGSPRHGTHIGSILIRELLDEHEFLACFCGHMHETPGQADVSDAPVVNLGFGSDAWLVFDTRTKAFEGLERVEQARE